MKEIRATVVNVSMRNTDSNIQRKKQCTFIYFNEEKLFARIGPVLRLKKQLTTK